MRSLLVSVVLVTGLLAPISPVAAQVVARTTPAPCSAGRISLTFDDGPQPGTTDRLVDVLTRLDVPATFFMVGRRVAAHPRLARSVERAGFLVANHSYDHVSMTRQSRREILRTFRRTDAAMRRAGLHPARVTRPPNAAIDRRVRRVMKEYGLVPVLFDVDPRDYAGGTTTRQITTRVLAQLRPRKSNVVVQHDGVRNSPASVAAVPRIVREARRRGYCFVALDDRGRMGFPVPTVRLVGGPASVVEGDPARLRVELDRPTARTTSVRVHLGDRSATAVLRAGRLRTTVAVPTTDDAVDEPDEVLTARLGRVSGLRRGQGRAVEVVVRDDDQ